MIKRERMDKMKAGHVFTTIRSPLAYSFSVLCSCFTMVSGTCHIVIPMGQGRVASEGSARHLDRDLGAGHYLHTRLFGKCHTPPLVKLYINTIPQSLTYPLLKGAGMTE